MMISVFQLIVLLCFASHSLAQQKYEFEFSSPQRKCPDDEKISKGDRVVVLADGFLRDGTQFYKNDTVQFTVGQRGSRVPLAYHRTLKGQCLEQKVIMVIPPRLGYELGRPAVIPADATMWHIVIVKNVTRIPTILRSGDLDKYSKISHLVRNPQNCVAEDKAKIGDRLIVNTRGFNRDQVVTEDEDDVDFVLGVERRVEAGWEQELVGRCAGEVVEIVIPGQETVVSVVRINAIVREEKAGPSCSDQAKVKPNFSVDLQIKAKLVKAGQPSRDGKVFFEKASYQSRFGEDKTGVKRGIEEGLEGACEGDARVILIGPKLGYGHEGNKAFQNNRRGAVPPGSNLRIEAQVNRVQEKRF